MQILPITPAYRACATGDLPTAEDLLTQNIHTDANDYVPYAHRSFVMARQHKWDHALEDAIRVCCIDRLIIAPCEKANFYSHSPSAFSLH
jgi:hypothetical protein